MRSMADPWHLRCLYCGAEESLNQTVCPRCQSPVGVVVCPSCSNWTPAGAGACPQCGGQLPGPAAGQELECARCPGALEEVTLVGGGVRVHRCRLCYGCFFEIRELAELEDRAARGDALPLDPLVAPPGVGLPAQSLLPMVRCPLCHREMERVRFDNRLPVVIDVCATHGLWLDAGETSAILDYLRARNKAGGTVPETSAERSERLEHANRMAQINAENASIEANVVSARSYQARRYGGWGYNRNFNNAVSALGRLILGSP